MRIWFNHWFSTAYHLIKLMREGCGHPITVIGTGSNDQAVYRRMCDEWYHESELTEKEYVEFCLEFCMEHKIEIFAPRRNLKTISLAADRFANIGVKLFVETNGAMVDMLDDKIRTYEFFTERIPEIIPDWKLVRSVNEFSDVCAEMTSPSGRLCYKLIVDEGGRSFRVLDDSIEGIGALYAKPGTKVTRRAAEAILSGYDFKVPIMIMPYLSGADVSVDCMETLTGRLMVPRFKVGRYSRVEPDAKIMELCNRIMDILRFDMPANIQFKMEGDRPYLLEINTRMSGGLQLSCLASGINIPAIALEKLYGNAIPWTYPAPWKSKGVVNLETPIIVDEGK